MENKISVDALYYKYYNELFAKSRKYYKEIKLLAEYIPFKSKNIAEIGSGTGLHAIQLIKYKPRELFLFDKNDIAINILRNKFNDFKNVSILKLNWQYNILENINIDVVLILFSLLQNFKNKDIFDKIIFNIINYLNSNGFFAFEFIDSDISRLYCENKNPKLLFKNKNSKVYLHSIYSKEYFSIIYSGILENRKYEYMVDLMNLTKVNLENKLNKLKLSYFFIPLDAINRKFICIIIKNE